MERRRFTQSILFIPLMLACSISLSSSINPWYQASFVIGRVVVQDSIATTIGEMVDATFIDLNSLPLHRQYLNVGQVTLNGISIPLRVDADTISYRLRSDSASIPTKFDGSYQHFTVEGNDGFPPITDSLQSPAALEIIAPTRADTISKHRGLTITWNQPQMPGTTIDLMAGGDDGKGIERSIPDNGTYTLSTEDLAQLQAGHVWLMLSRKIERVESVNDTFKTHYSMMIATIVFVKTTLVD